MFAGLLHQNRDLQWREQQRPQWLLVGMQVDRSQWVQQEGTGVFELNPRFEPRKAVSLEHERKSRMMRKRLSRSVLQVLCRSTLKIVLWYPALLCLLALTQTLAKKVQTGNVVAKPLCLAHLCGQGFPWMEFLHRTPQRSSRFVWKWEF